VLALDGFDTTPNLRLEIKRHDLIEVRNDAILDPLVLGVREVAVASRGISEAHDKTVGVALVEPFRTRVSTADEFVQPGNLVSQPAQLFKKACNLRLRRRRLELQKHYVLDFSHKSSLSCWLRVLAVRRFIIRTRRR
jgi:hypothetical protein